MSGVTALVAALLLAAAALVAWRAQRIRARRRRVLASGRRGGGVDPDDALVQWIRDLGRTPDGLGEHPVASAHPVGVAYEPGATAGSSGRATALGWPVRDVTGGPSWPGMTARSARPAGPTRPPSRRDLRRPSCAAEPEQATMLDADLRPGPYSAPPHPPGRAADARPDRRDHRSVGSADATPGEPAPVRVSRSTNRVLSLVGLVGGGVGAVVGGPVAAVAVAGYGTLAVRAVLRWRVNRNAERNRRRGLDQLCGLAADLRAGLPVPQALEVAAVEGGGASRLRHLTSAAVRLADRTGAPLAELVERIEADARATDRGLAAAAAQAAGARATAWLLAALPVGGIGLGYGIGVNPMAVLLHSTVGGACAVVAVALQVVGLLWAERLGATPGQPG